MPEHARVWTFLLFLSVIGVVGLAHAGLNLGASLGALVSHLLQIFGAPL